MFFSYRSTPVETLHTVLLGPYKYLLRSLITRMTATQKEELQACLSSYDFTIDWAIILLGIFVHLLEEILKLLHKLHFSCWDHSWHQKKRRFGWHFQEWVWCSLNFVYNQRNIMIYWWWWLLLLRFIDALSRFSGLHIAKNLSWVIVTGIIAYTQIL